MKRDKIWKITFGVYICLLILFVVIKFDGSIYTLIDKISSVKENRNDGLWNYNLILFGSISPYLKNISSSYALKNILGNIVPFILLGFLIPVNFKKYRNLIKTMLLCFVGIVSIEIFQFVTMLGYFDVDDILLNTVGCLVGYCTFAGFKAIFKKHS